MTAFGPLKYICDRRPLKLLQNKEVIDLPRKNEHKKSGKWHNEDNSPSVPLCLTICTWNGTTAFRGRNKSWAGSNNKFATTVRSKLCDGMLWMEEWYSWRYHEMKLVNKSFGTIDLNKKKATPWGAGPQTSLSMSLILSTPLPQEWCNLNSATHITTNQREHKTKQIPFFLVFSSATISGGAS